MARPDKTGAKQPDITGFIAETFSQPLDTKRHDVPERHSFGEAFLAPDSNDVAPVGPAPQSASPGTSEKFARADHVHAFAGGGGTGGVTDHGQLTGLADDDHPQYTLTAEAQAIADASVNTHEGKVDPHTQYLTAARGDALFLTPAEGNTAYETKGAAAAGDSAHVAAADPHTQYLRVPEIVAGTNVVLDTTTTPGSVIIGATPGGSGVTDHGLLTGLGDDDHPQYLTNARGDALFLTPAEGNAAYAPTAHNHDAAYVNVSGDTMTGPLVIAGISGSGNIVTTGKIKPKYQAIAGLVAITPVTAWSQFPLSAIAGAEQLGNLITANNITIPEAGLYSFHAFVLLDRVVTGIEMSVQDSSGRNVAYVRWPSPTPQTRFQVDGLAYFTGASYLTCWMVTGGGCIAGGNAESVFYVVSHF